MVALLIFLFFFTQLYAAEFGFLTGSEVDTEGQSYSYVGLMGGKEIRSTTLILGKLWADYLVYKFDHSGKEVKAEAPAFQLSAGVKKRYETWSVTFWAGWERRDTKVSPDLPGVKVKGVDNSLVAQFELFNRYENGFSSEFMLSYTSATSYLWSRGRVKKALFGSKTYLGVELIGQGNADYRAVQSGLLAGLSLGELSTAFRVGYRNSSKGDGAYAGLEVYIGF